MNRFQLDEDYANYLNDNYTPEEQMAMFYRGLYLTKLRIENKKLKEESVKREEDLP